VKAVAERNTTKHVPLQSLSTIVKYRRRKMVSISSCSIRTPVLCGRGNTLDIGALLHIGGEKLLKHSFNRLISIPLSSSLFGTCARKMIVSCTYKSPADNQSLVSLRKCPCEASRILAYFFIFIFIYFFIFVILLTNLPYLLLQFHYLIQTHCS
jgi:hypothetical protein